MHSDLIEQSHSFEGDLRRDYRPYPLNEQLIIDFIAFLCMVIDTYVFVTIVSFLYFPEHISTIQNTTLMVLFTLFAAKQCIEFLWQLSQHCEFVNSRKQFTTRAYENPNIEYICQLTWVNPDSFLDFRTHPVRVGQRFIREPVIISGPPVAVPMRVEPPVRMYNTRSQARIQRAATAT